MKLITETIEDVQILTEETNEQERLQDYNVFMQQISRTVMNRIYPVETLAKEVRRYTKEFIEKKRVI